MKKRPKILITNDDGIHAPGIKHLWNALKDMADLFIIAPTTDQSAVSLSITLRQPLNIQKISWPEPTLAWSVNGTPADCVKLALAVILDSKPDLVVAGINRGTNSGRNILYSGTVAGTIEGVFHHIPGIAFSCHDYFDPDFLQAESYIPKIVDYIIKHPLPTGTLLNVNFPAKEHGLMKGIKMARQGKAYWMEKPTKRDHPFEGHSYYWLGAEWYECQEQENSDVYWLEKGFATAVPVHIAELTDHNHITQSKDHFDSWFH
jgi:5'-nucleotidase